MQSGERTFTLFRYWNNALRFLGLSMGALRDMERPWIVPL